MISTVLHKPFLASRILGRFSVVKINGLIIIITHSKWYTAQVLSLEIQTSQRELENLLGNCHFPVGFTQIPQESNFTRGLIVDPDGYVDILQTSSLFHQIPTKKDSLCGFRKPWRKWQAHVGNDNQPSRKCYLTTN